MTKKTQGLKSLSKSKSKKRLTSKRAKEIGAKGGRAGRRERIADLLTKEQKQTILDKCIEKANEGDTVMLKSMQEQIWGRPVATLEAKVDSNVMINVVDYGSSTDTL